MVMVRKHMNKLMRWIAEEEEGIQSFQYSSLQPHMAIHAHLVFALKHYVTH